MPSQAWPLKESNKCYPSHLDEGIQMAFLLESHQLVRDLRLARKFGMIEGIKLRGE